MRVKVHIALWMVTLIYATTFSIAKMVMPVYIKPFGFILLRVFVACVCILAFHRIFIKERVYEKSDYLKLLICAVFGVAANMLFFFKGLSITTPINASVLMLNTPIFVVLFSTIWFKEKLNWKKATGTLLATVGAVLLVGGSKFQFNSSRVLGDIFVALNAIIFAFYLVYAKSLMHKYHPITVSLYSFMFGLLLVLPFGFSDVLNVAWTELPPSILFAMLFVTVGSTFLTYILNAYALRHASSSLVGTYIYLQPVLATIIAVIMGTDALSTEKLAFMAIVFSGVYLAAFRKNNEH